MRVEQVIISTSSRSSRTLRDSRHTPAAPRNDRTLLPRIGWVALWRRSLCNNDRDRGILAAADDMLSARMSESRRIALWAILGSLAALLTYIAFRGYLSPDFLINFSNSFRC